MFLTSCSLTNPYFLDLNKEEQEKFKILTIDKQCVNGLDMSQVYSLNANEFSELIENSGNTKIVIFFTYWCPNSREFLPGFLEKLTHVNNLDVYLVSPDDWVKKYQYYEYIKRNNIRWNVFLLDVYAYGKQRSPHHRMRSFLDGIKCDCEEVGGFPSVILFDKSNKILYKPAANIEVDSVFHYLKRTDKQYSNKSGG